MEFVNNYFSISNGRLNSINRPMIIFRLRRGTSFVVMDLKIEGILARTLSFSKFIKESVNFIFSVLNIIDKSIILQIGQPL